MRWHRFMATRLEAIMLRSEINRAIAEAKACFAEHRFLLPAFAHLAPDEMGRKLTADSRIYRGRLGWDVSDFGAGDFATNGIVLFTMRNGDKDALPTGRGRLYCEKALYFAEGQGCPSHSHYVKTEDIINRGGGPLRIHLTSADIKGTIRKGPSTVFVDEEPVTFEEKATVTLAPGQSIVLHPGMFHALEAGDEPVFLGEVSLVNDDIHDNIFPVPVPRFPEIVEDEPPLHLLCSDYDQVLGARS
jgi:D-lyxose ketol-isomerase